jgi:outer membrane protein assembly factor BamB
MAMTGEQFLDQLEQAGLLDLAEMADVRQLVGAAARRLGGPEVADLLVKKGLLTKGQAGRLLGAAETERKPAAAKKEKPGSKPTGRRQEGGAPAPRSPPPPRTPPAEEELGLAPLEELGFAPLENEEPAKPAVEEDLGLAPLDEDEERTRPDGSVVILQAADETPTLQPLPEPIVDLKPMDAGLEPLGAAPGLMPFGGAGDLPPAVGLQPLDDLGAPTPLGAGGAPPVPGQIAFGAPEALAPAATPPPPPQFALKKSPWDTKLMLVGGGSLLLLTLLGVLLYYALMRGSSGEVFAAAEEDYKSQNYPQAIARYEQFATEYPSDPNVSAARVKIGTGRLWEATKLKDQREALKLAKEVLPTIEKETAFADIRNELASILPGVAEGFATQAALQEERAKAQELVDFSEEAMKLVNSPSYIPSSLRKSIEARLNSIQENIDKAKRRINSSQRLEEVVTAIQKAVEAGQTTQAYALRRSLLREYPELEPRPSLVAAVRSITEKERALVKVSDARIEPERQDPPRSSQFQVALASRRGTGSSGNENLSVCFLARGAVYGLQATTGRLLWRRFVGHETLSQPLPLSAKGEGDVLVVDGRRNELLRLKLRTGELVWRLAVGEPFAGPVIDGARLLLTTQSGKLLVVETETGLSPRRATLPQKLIVAPTVSRGQVLYQVGEHSNLYLLDAETLECRDVYYLAHKAGTVAVAPVLSLGHLFVAENSGESVCDLHVLACDADGGALKPVKKSPIRLTGRVVVPPQVLSGRVVLVTDLGAIHVLEINTANADQPVLEAVKPVPASFKTPTIGYFLADSGRLWVGNERLTRFELQTSKNQMLSKAVQFERDSFVAPPRLLGDTVFHLRRRNRSPAYTVTAARVDDNQTVWEVDVATPVALLGVDLPKKQVHAVSTQAELFEITTEAFQAGRLDQPAGAAAGAARTTAFADPVPLADGTWALSSEQDRSHAVIYHPQASVPAGRLASRQFKAASGAQVTCGPVAFAGGLVLALDNGQVAVADPVSGDQKLSPFQSSVEADAKVAWRRPAVVGAEGKELVIADNRKQIFRLGIKGGPSPQLAAVLQKDLEIDLATPLVAINGTVYGAVRNRQADTLVALSATDLTVVQEWPVEGRIVWGPEAVGSVGLAVSDRQQLLCIEAGQKLRWTTDLKYGPLAGRPLPVGNDFLLASQSGVVWRVSGSDGSEAGKLEIGEPLATGAVAFGPRLICGGSDGTLHVIPALAGGE